MEQIAWDSSMTVGVEILDADHRKLLDLFNGLLETEVTQKARDDLETLLGRLLDYTDRHFAREEAMMEQRGYPDIVNHKAAHRFFVEEISKLRSDFESDNTMMLRIDLILLLKEWFIEHIQTTDKRYQPYIGDTVSH